MKEILCTNCKNKLGEVDEEELSVIYEHGVKPIQPTFSNGLLAFAFDCPHCGKSSITSVTVNS